MSSKSGVIPPHDNGGGQTDEIISNIRIASNIPDNNRRDPASSTKRIPKTFHIKATNRIVKSRRRHVKNSDKHVEKIFQTFDKIMEKLDIIETQLTRDQKCSKARNFNIYNKWYNGTLKEADATLHKLVIIESDNIDEIGNSIPNGPIRIQDIDRLSLSEAEKILKYLEFQNFNDVAPAPAPILPGVSSNIASRVSGLRNQVRKLYGLTNYPGAQGFEL